jgi:hypothetical protein
VFQGIVAMAIKTKRFGVEMMRSTHSSVLSIIRTAYVLPSQLHVPQQPMASVMTPTELMRTQRSSVARQVIFMTEWWNVLET